MSNNATGDAGLVPLDRGGRRMSGRSWTIVAGALALIVLGLAVPGATWLSWLGVGDDGGVRGQGATLWRLSLVVVGAFTIAGVRRGWWSSRGSAHAANRRSVLGDPALIALLVVATALRLYRLGEGLWIDEVITLTHYAQKPFGFILSSYDSNNQHSLFSLFAHASILVFGDSASSLRLPAALFGIGSLAAVYALGREVGSRSEALLATALLTFSYQHVWFSQNARGYSGLLLFATLSSLFLIRALRDPEDGKSWLGFAVTVALGMYVHLTMVFVVAAQFGVLAVEAARDWPRFRRAWEPVLLGGFGAAVLFTILLYALILPQVPAASAKDESGVATWRNPLWMIAETVRGLQLGAAGGVVGAVGLVVVALGIVDFWRRDRALVILLIGSVASGALAMIALGHHLWPRFFIYAGGFGALIIVRGVMRSGDVASRLVGWSPARGRAVSTVLLIAAIAVLARSLRWVYRPKQDYAGARIFIEQTRGPGDAVVSMGVARSPLKRYYAREWATADSVAQVRRLMEAHPRTWFVYTLRVEMENEHPDMLEVLDRDFRLARSFDGSLGGGTIYVYVHDRAGAGSPPGGSAN